MDSVTQAVLGASIAGAVAPTGQRRKALLVGAALGTLPDLDVFIDYGGAVENFTYHRGFSHSLLVLAPFSFLLWLGLRRWWAPVREAPRRWLAAIALALLTHPLLDAHTAYGTQLFWPLTLPPTMWSTIFIIDPLFTLPLLVATLLAAFAVRQGWSGDALRIALGLSTLYLAWTWVAHGVVERNVRESLATMNLEDAPVFLVPTPFNTLLWRAVVMTDSGYLEGFDSLLLHEGPVQFAAYESNNAALHQANSIWAVARLRWFSRGFVRARVTDGRLLLTDLRMGQEPVYVFTHVAAVRGNPHWKATTTELLPVSFDSSSLGVVWNRIWSE